MGQISSRALRLHVYHEDIHIITESHFDDIIATIKATDIDIIIIDSLSVLSSQSIEGTP